MKMPLLVIERSTQTLLVLEILLLATARSLRIPPVITIPLLATMRSPPTPLASTMPLLVMLRLAPTLLVAVTLCSATARSTTTTPPPIQWQWGMLPPLAPPHTTIKEAHISGIRQDTPQARALTTTPFSGIRQDTALPPERITSCSART